VTPHCVIIAPPLYQGPAIAEGFRRIGWEATLFTFHDRPRHSLLNPVNWLRRREPGRDPAMRFDAVLGTQALPFAEQRGAAALVVLRPDAVSGRTEEALRRSRIPLATWVIDSLGRHPRQRSLSPFARAEFFLDGGDAPGHNGHWLPLGVDEDLLRPDAPPKTTDILFIGNLVCPMYSRRRAAFLELAASGLHRRFRCSAIVSDGGRLRDEALKRRTPFPVSRSVDIAEYVRRISEARLCVNVMPSDGESPINDAFMLVPALGTCQLTDPAPYLAKWLTPEVDFACYEDGRLARRIEDLLLDQTKIEGIAAQGRRATLGNHTYRHRARFILERMGL
jgi:hypothetical protein